jgi:serine protease Do
MSNEPDQDLDEPEEEVISPDSHKRGFLAKALVVLTVLAFMVYSLPNFSYLFSSRLDFLEQNRTLQEDPVVRKCRPAVVNIVAVGDGDSLHTILHQGSGFNISPAGIVITNQHVVAGAHTISISFADGSKYFTDRYRTLPGIDIAIITFAGKNLPALTINWRILCRRMTPLPSSATL